MNEHAENCLSFYYAQQEQHLCLSLHLAVHYQMPFYIKKIFNFILAKFLMEGFVKELHVMDLLFTCLQSIMSYCRMPTTSSPKLDNCDTRWLPGCYGGAFMSGEAFLLPYPPLINPICFPPVSLRVSQM